MSNREEQLVDAASAFHEWIKGVGLERRLAIPTILRERLGRALEAYNGEEREPERVLPAWFVDRGPMVRIGDPA